MAVIRVSGEETTRKVEEDRKAVAEAERVTEKAAEASILLLGSRGGKHWT
ncbi:hypothetical protein ACFLYL_00500 [Chloroflexota bacterium]